MISSWETLEIHKFYKTSAIQRNVLNQQGTLNRHEDFPSPPIFFSSQISRLTKIRIFILNGNKIAKQV